MACSRAGRTRVPRPPRRVFYAHQVLEPRALGKPFDHFLGNRLTPRSARFRRRPNGPNTLLDSLDRQRFLAKEPVLNGEAAGTPVRHTGIDLDDVAERRRQKKVAARLHQRYARDLKMFQHRSFFHAQSSIKKRVRAGVKILEITREKHDSKGIAISPFNPDFLSVDQHDWSPKHPVPAALAGVYRRTVRPASDLVFECAFTVDCGQERI